MPFKFSHLNTNFRGIHSNSTMHQATWKLLGRLTICARITGDSYPRYRCAVFADLGVLH